MLNLLHPQGICPLDSICNLSLYRVLDHENLNPDRFAGDHSKSEPPDPFPNSVVKPLRADGSVALAM